MDFDSIEKELLDIFSKSLHDNIKIPKNEPILVKYKDDRVQEKKVITIEEIQNQIKTLCDNKKNGEQVSCLLDYFYQIKPPYRIEKNNNYAQYLIEKSYYLHWSNELKQYYNKNLAIILGYKYHYFISFARKKSDTGTTYQINKDYIDYIDDMKINQNDKDKMNLLARALYEDFKSRKLHLNGYLDEENLTGNINTHIKEACEKTIFFIQIINNDIFIKDAENNFCFQEFQFIKNGIETQKIYIKATLCEKILKSRHIGTGLKDWYHEATNENYYIDLCDSSVENISIIFRDKVFKKIEDYIDNMIDESINFNS